MSQMHIHESAETPEPIAAIEPEGVGEPHEVEPEAEQDRPKIAVIAAAIAGTLILLVGILVGVNEIFRQVVKREIEGKVLSHPGSELRELRAQEDQKLGRYQWVSKKDGVVRVPLSRAMELTLIDYRARSARRD